jgi:hypothetical protein
LARLYRSGKGVVSGFFFTYYFRIREAQKLNTIYTSLESYEWVGAVAALVGKLCLAASFAVIYIHSGEIFPTTIRNSAMGLVSVAARCGGIVAPFIVLLGLLFCIPINQSDAWHKILKGLG